MASTFYRDGMKIEFRDDSTAGFTHRVIVARGTSVLLEDWHRGQTTATDAAFYAERALMAEVTDEQETSAGPCAYRYGRS